MKSLVMRRMVSGLCPPADDAFGVVCTSRRITMGLPERDCCRLCKKGWHFLWLSCHHPGLSSLPRLLGTEVLWAREAPGSRELGMLSDKHPLTPPRPVKSGHRKGFLPQQPQLRRPDENMGRTKNTPTALVLLQKSGHQSLTQI